MPSELASGRSIRDSPQTVPGHNRCPVGLAVFERRQVPLLPRVRQRQERPSNLVQVYLAPALGQRPAAHLALPDGAVRLDFKRPWSDGTTSIEISPLALIVRLATLVLPFRRHVTRYSGVISSHSSLRTRIVPASRVTPRERRRQDFAATATFTLHFMQRGCLSGVW